MGKEYSDLRVENSLTSYRYARNDVPCTVRRFRLLENTLLCWACPVLASVFSNRKKQSVCGDTFTPTRQVWFFRLSSYPRYNKLLTFALRSQTDCWQVNGRNPFSSDSIRVRPLRSRVLVLYIAELRRNQALGIFYFIV